MTAVLKGLGLPTPGQVPPVCSMGGLGGPFHRKLIPTLAMISGPWSLYAPSFRESAIDYGRMRSQLLAVGDSVLALDGLPRRADRRRLPGDARAAGAGAPTCPAERYPQFAPGPGLTLACWRAGGARALARRGSRRDHAAAPAEVGARRQRLHPSRLARARGRHRLRRVVRVRAGPAAAAHGSARGRDARLRRVRGLRPDVRVHPAHGAQGQRRHLPALADQHRHPVSRARSTSSPA